jgi:hypothetical protein
MRTRLAIFDIAGSHPPVGIDTGWTSDQVDQWVREQCAIMRGQGARELVVVRLEPLAGGDEAVRPLRNINAWRLALRTLPDGRVELSDLHDYQPDPESGEVPRDLLVAQMPGAVCRAFAVVHGPERLANRRCGIRGRRPPPSMERPPPLLRLNRHQRARVAARLDALRDSIGGEEA